MDDKKAEKKGKWVAISPKGCVLDGVGLPFVSENQALFSEIYKERIGDYPKFFKMDKLCRMGFVVSELLLQALGEERFVSREDRAVIIFTHCGSLDADRHFQQTIQNADDYFPAPAVFVYTLPNIVTGEIAIRNRYLGETSCYVLPFADAERMGEIIKMAFSDLKTESVLWGWLDYRAEDCFEAVLTVSCKNDGEDPGVRFREIQKQFNLR